MDLKIQGTDWRVTELALFFPNLDRDKPEKLCLSNKPLKNWFNVIVFCHYVNFINVILSSTVYNAVKSTTC